MCAIPQLVLAPLNPIPIAEHFRRSHPQCEHSYGQHIYVTVHRILATLVMTRARHVRTVRQKMQELSRNDRVRILLNKKCPLCYSTR